MPLVFRKNPLSYLGIKGIISAIYIYMKLYSCIITYVCVHMYIYVFIYIYETIFAYNYICMCTYVYIYGGGNEKVIVVKYSYLEKLRERSTGIRCAIPADFR